LRFSNTFDVPLPTDQAWAVLMDIPAIAPCMPGAELTGKVDDRTYKGKVSVRLGPVALTFAGTAAFQEIDEQARSAKVKAQGTDSKGRGGANALIEFRLEPQPGGSKVIIDTDLNLSGSVAQYGRGAGMIQSVAAQLIGQFSQALRAQIAASEPATASSTEQPEAAGRAKIAGTPPSAAKPIGGFSLVFKALWASVLGLFRRAA
jgi:hypothetical protein